MLTFAEALVRAQAGEIIRRKAWDSDFYAVWRPSLTEGAADEGAAKAFHIPVDALVEWVGSLMLVQGKPEKGWVVEAFMPAVSDIASKDWYVINA